MRRTYKKLIALCAVLVFSLSLIPVTAFAQDPFTNIAIGGLTGASGAGLFSSMAAISGINIGYNSTDPVDAMWNKLNPDHVYFNGEKHEATGTGEDVYDYINVDIGDWLDAQSAFIVNFAQTYNVTDNSSGSVSTGIYFDGIPIDQTWDNKQVSATLGIQEVPTTTGASTEINAGKFRVILTKDNTGLTIAFYYNGTFISSGHNNNTSGSPYRLVLELNSNNAVQMRCIKSTNYSAGYSSAIGSPSTSQNVNWSSNEVDLTVADNWGSAKVKIPTNQLTTGWTVADFIEHLNELWQLGNEDQIVVEDGSDVPPVPPVPVPTTPLGEVPFDDWQDLFGNHVIEGMEDLTGLGQDIFTNQVHEGNTVDDIADTLGNIEDLQESIDTNIDTANDSINNIDTNIGIGNSIMSGIRSVVNTISTTLTGIAEAVAELVESVVMATETLIAGILNQIPTVFGIILTPFKTASTIWHYVVEWLASISAPFTWFRTMVSGTSYYIILPVYASLAGTVVLAFFKRFGR